MPGTEIVKDGLGRGAAKPMPENLVMKKSASVPQNKREAANIFRAKGKGQKKALAKM